MADLSPAAQAVLNEIAAATLRAAADRMECRLGGNPHPKFADGVLSAVAFLEHIAAELEGQQ